MSSSTQGCGFQLLSAHPCGCPWQMAIEEDPFYEQVAREAASARAQKESRFEVEPRFGGDDVDEVDDGEKRGINYQILKNKGLTPYKKQLNRNPRVKKREAYRKAQIKRKGQIREVRPSEAGHYGGETTGINTKVVRTRKGKK
jgi:U3 small nucleolar RNA-associated protein 3